MHIIFKTIEFKNVLTFGNNVTVFDLNNGLSNLIYGKNGQGKSSIYEAITYALYGKPYRNVNINQIINKHNKKDLWVKITFTIGLNNYQVIRGMKPKIFEIYKNGDLVKTTNAPEYQKYLVEEILNMSYKTFCQIVILGNATYTQFMKLDSSARREVVEQILGLQIFSNMKKILKTKYDDNARNLDTIKYEINNSKSKIQYVKELIDKQKQDNEKQILQKNNESVILKNDIKALIDKIESTKDEHDDLVSTINSLSANIQSKNKEIIEIESKITSNKNYYNRQTNFFKSNTQCPTCKQGISDEHTSKIYSELETVQNEIDNYQKEVDNHQKNLRSLNDEYSIYKKKFDDLVAIVSQCKNELQLKNGLLQSIDASIKQLSKKTELSKEMVNEAKELNDKLKKDMVLLEKYENDDRKFKKAALLLKDNGIKALIIKNYLPLINKEVNKYLQILDMFINFNLDETFNESIKAASFEEYSYFAFSEGEKFRIDLALLMTWREISKVKNSCSTNLLFLDETFDSSLDKDGEASMVQLLQELNTNKHTVYVISHRSEIEECFDKVMEVKKVRGFSQII